MALQSGRFDHAARQFFSVPTTWKGIAAGSSDVKELIPELFFLPEALTNASGFDLGRLPSTGKALGDVELPVWASDARDFIQKHRAALESEHVSMNLHHWIDLIFGYKQRGQAAVEAINVFLFSSYEGNIDLSRIADPQERKAMEGMIRELGQTPSQLLTAAHPQRYPRGDSRVAPSPVTDAVLLGDLAKGWAVSKAYFVETVADDPVALIAIQPPPETSVAEWMRSGLAASLYTVSERGVVGVNNWLPDRGSKGRPFTLEVDPAPGRERAPQAGRTLGGAVRRHPRLGLAPHRAVLGPDHRSLIVAGALDGAVRVCLLSPSLPGRTKVVGTVQTGAVAACLALDRGSTALAVGLCSGAVTVHGVEMGAAGDANYRITAPRRMLLGVEGGAVAVALSIELGIVAVGSAAGRVYWFELSSGRVLRCVSPVALLDPSAAASTIEWLGMSPHGTIVVHVRWWPADASERSRHCLFSFSVNGALLASDAQCGSLSALAMAPSGRYVVGCRRRGAMLVRNAETLAVEHEVDMHKPVTVLTVTRAETHVLVALNDGKLVVVPLT